MQNIQTPINLSTPVRQALDYVAQEKFSEAKELLKPILKDFPQEEELLRLYIYCADCLDEQVERALEKEETSGWPRSHFHKHWNIAYDLAEKKEYAAAIEMFEKIAQTYLNESGQKGAYSPAIYQLACCWYLLGDKAKAKAYYQQFWELVKKAPTWNNFARVRHLMKDKKYMQALDELEKEISEDPNAGENYLMRARIFDEMHNEERAREDRQTARDCFEAQTQVRPFASYLCDRKAQACEELQDYPAALEANAKAIALWPQNYDYRVKRVCLLVKNNQSRAAVLYRQQVCEGQFYRQYKKDFFAQGQLCEAFKNYERAAYYYQIGPIGRRNYLALKEVYKKMNCPEKMDAIKNKMSRAPKFKDRVCEPMLEELLEEK